MAVMTGGEAIVKTLAREGVRVVFGLPGVQLYGIGRGYGWTDPDNRSWRYSNPNTGNNTLCVPGLGCNFAR